MQIGTFRKNVMKTVATKPAKLGLRVVSKNTVRVGVAHATLALKKDTGNLMRGLSQYIIGFQMTQEMKDTAFAAMADMGYDIIVLARLLKAKTPTATKKVKLTGTRSSALMQIDGLTTDLLALVEEGVFSGPKMTKTKKMIVLPNQAGKKEEREVEIVDVAAEVSAETEREAKMRAILDGVIDLYWRLCFDIFQKTPDALFADKFARLQQKYPNVQFDLGDKKQPKAEAPQVA